MMDDPSLIFPKAEYTTRLAALQQEICQNEIGAVLLTSPADFFYFTGFLTRFWESPARAWFLVIPAQGLPAAVIPSIGAELMQRTWITDIRTWDAPDPKDDGVSLLASVLRDMLPSSGRLGVPTGPETHLRMPMADYDRFTQAISPRHVVDATAIVRRVREVKSEAELAKIRTICNQADRAFDAVTQILRPRQSMAELFREFQISLLREGADWISYVAGAAGPSGYGDVISPATTDPIQVGDVVMLDTGAVKDGYFCDFDRNWSIGPAAPDTQRTYQALWQATETALERLRPGMKASDAYWVLHDALRDRDVTPGAGRFGHGLGITLTEWPSFTPMDHTELREGMVLTLEPSAEISPGCLQVHEENIVLRADGPELLHARAAPEIIEIAL